MRKLLLILLIVGCSPKITSYNTQYYMDLGIADPSKSWDVLHYKNSLRILQKVKNESFLDLPSLDNDRNNEIFKRLISKENHELIVSDLFNDESSDFIRSFPQFLLVYVDESVDKQPFRDELTELQIAYLNINEVMLNGIKQYGIDLSAPQFQEPINKMKNGYGVTLLSLIGSQTDTTVFEIANLNKLSSSVSSSILNNWEFIPYTTRFTIIIRAQEIIETNISETISSSYQKVLDTFANNR